MNDSDIKVEYHPKAKKPAKIYCFESYNSAIPDCEPENIAIDPEPWKPFRTRLDFELAEFIIDAHLNVPQTKQLLSLIRTCTETPNAFTIKDPKELSQTWEHARVMKASTVGYPVL